MDTIDLTITTNKKISDCDWEELRKIKNINAIRLKANNRVIVLSFPRYFYTLANAFLITKEKEVNEVLENLENTITRLGYNIESVLFLKIDYPFTHYRPATESFNSWKQIWAFIKLCSELGGWQYKGYGGLLSI
ncbi:hypothetical protein [Ilyobacter polytropus]|uniref:Uncharacterized protein n=1 Tax=Ilyobacter polytropus (strain ATCC 51220 / DSM 2926 / LMG 16218 / CuHBu1) TaxID=572544 RepID=E3H8B9_ILYPC|nr:hypothetical protein [Ilyobacter polytropus]ADO82686.1 hypothetical protein Ilyop_0901 [Ilyobacter polytropus DSM 2926]